MRQTRKLQAVALGLVGVLAAWWPVPCLAQNGQARPATALKIVVVEGEGSVNIIQHKTAVAPVVEVRDRNDQPVAGAIVRFAVTKGRATLNGARVLTVTTNAAGRAAAAGLAPTGTGALQIGATATFQGQAAAITIAQTNVMTAAEAAQVAAASTASSGGGAGAAGGGAAGGGSGGVSATTVGVIGGAAAGGALAVTKLTGDTPAATPTETTYRGPFDGILSTTSGICTFDTRHSGTVNLVITVRDSGAVTGHGGVDAMDTIIRVGQCGPSVVIGTTEMHGCCNPAPQVTGTTQNLSFIGSHPGLSGTNWTYTFKGALSGSQVTGVFSLSVQSPAVGGAADFPVTLVKQ